MASLRITHLRSTSKIRFQTSFQIRYQILKCWRTCAAKLELRDGKSRSSPQVSAIPFKSCYRMRRDLVKPLKVVTGRLQKLPCDIEGVEAVLNEVWEAVEELQLVLNEL